MRNTISEINKKSTNQYLNVIPGNTVIVMIRENKYENGCDIREFGLFTLKNRF